MFYRDYLKRSIDIVASGSALLILSPIIGTVSVILYFANKGAGVFFSQDRPGKDEKIFKAIKFKSMTDEKDSEGKLLPNKDRLTKVGKFIRKTSIDELPQLWNVFKGDMSLIGPRPLFVEYLPYYTEREHKRHFVRPGITGLAQVNGRNHVPWDQRLEFDVKYAENVSFLGDLKIIFKTVKNVFIGKDIEVAPNKVKLNVEREKIKNKII